MENLQKKDLSTSRGLDGLTDIDPDTFWLVTKDDPSVPDDLLSEEGKNNDSLLVQSKVEYTGIAVRNVTLPHRYGNSHDAIRVRTLLLASRQR